MARTLIGIVSSAAADKTIVIKVESKRNHRIYKKQYSVTSKFMAHDENNDCRVGDKVTIVETRPISARKRFKLDKIVQKAQLTEKDLAAIKEEPKTEKAEPKTEVKS